MKKNMMVAVLVLMGALTGCLKTRSEVQEVENKKQMQEQVVTLQRSTADQSARFSEIDEDIRKLNGRIEVMENQGTQNAGKERSVQTQIDELNRKISLLQETIVKMENDLASGSRENRNPNMGGAKEAAPSKGGIFDRAEAQFKKKEWKDAIINYQKYRDSNPNGKQFGEATYKIGVCFQELGMKDEAKVFYEEAIAKGKGEVAKRARARLKQVQ